MTGFRNDTKRQQTPNQDNTRNGPTTRPMTTSTIRVFLFKDHHTPYKSYLTSGAVFCFDPSYFRTVDDLIPRMDRHIGLKQRSKKVSVVVSAGTDSSPFSRARVLNVSDIRDGDALVLH
mmetsp:Transcript_1844/g.4428  ORF Transcript_1844/g.4428 Transcript_1844/m.4428 type:complete len:119 (+) Transcript_1844:102-458(+)